MAIERYEQNQRKTYLTTHEMNWILDAAYTSGEKVVDWKTHGYSSIDSCCTSIKAAINRRKKMLAVEADRDNDLVVIFNPLKRKREAKPMDSVNPIDTIDMHDSIEMPIDESRLNPIDSIKMSTDAFDIVESIPKFDKRGTISKYQAIFDPMESQHIKCVRIRLQHFGVDEADLTEVKRFYKSLYTYIWKNKLPYKVYRDTSSTGKIYVERVDTLVSLIRR